jgi:putative pyruvate formate lyase activating enzyme
VLRFIAEPDAYVNLVDRYRPCFEGLEHEPLARRPTSAELRDARAAARRAGLRRLDPHSIC